MLVLLVAWHAMLIALPIATAIVAALRGGVRDLALLALYGLACGGLAAFVLFWAWWASPTAGALASIAAIAASAMALGSNVARIDRSTLRLAAPLGVAGLLWAAYALFVLAFGLAPLGFMSPLGAVQHHFGLPLPYDNVLPFMFAQQVAGDKVTIPMTEQWLTSDRPPLQTAYYLASLAVLLPRADMHYQVQSTLLQALWLPGMWLLLRSFAVQRAASAAALLATMLSGFALLNELFTWPKLFPAAYLAVAAAVVLNGRRDALADRRVAAAVGASVALAMLCHPGSLFVLAGLVVLVIALKRVPPARFLVVAGAAAFTVALPWMLYQKLVDPPGNRLMKWHLAGVIDVDDRTTLQAVRDSYSALTLDEWLGNKRENLKWIVGLEDSAPLTLKASTGALDDRQAGRLRTLQFYSIVTALGPLALAPLALLVPGAWRRREFAASWQLLAMCLITMVPWVLLMYLPTGTLIHTGSYAVMCFLFAGSVLAFYAASPWLAAAALVAHAILTINVYARGAPIAQGATMADYRSFNAIAVLALAATAALLWRLCRDVPAEAETSA